MTRVVIKVNDIEITVEHESFVFSISEIVKLSKVVFPQFKWSNYDL